MVIDTHAIFKLLGLALACYVAYAVYRGGIWSTNASWRSTSVYWERSESPWEFWSSVIIYGLLSLAMMTVF